MFRYAVKIDDGPIDFDRIAKSGQMFRWLITESGWTAYDGGHVYHIRSLEKNRFEVESNQDESSFRRLLRLEKPHDKILDEIRSRGPEIEPFLIARQGLRILRPHSRAETLFSFLCSSCNHISRITGMVWHLANLGEGCFPTIETIANTSESTLRELGFGYRGATIPKVAGILASIGGENYLDDMANGSYQDVRNELIAMPGIGKKLADCICLFALDHGESVPIDTHIWQVLTRLYYPDWVGTSLTDRKYETAAAAFRDRFGEHAGAAHQFLFVDNMERYRER